MFDSTMRRKYIANLLPLQTIVCHHWPPSIRMLGSSSLPNNPSELPQKMAAALYEIAVTCTSVCKPIHTLRSLLCIPSIRL